MRIACPVCRKPYRLFDRVTQAEMCGECFRTGASLPAVVQNPQYVTVDVESPVENFVARAVVRIGLQFGFALICSPLLFASWALKDRSPGWSGVILAALVVAIVVFKFRVGRVAALLVDQERGLVDSLRIAFHLGKQEGRSDAQPNQSLEPTRVLGTSAAEPPRVPSTPVAHL